MPIDVTDPAFQMWVTYGVILGALVLYATERVTLEITSLGVIIVLLVFFHYAPLTDSDGVPAMDATRILAGFANPALVTVVALLVVGQGLVRTGGLERAANIMIRSPRRYAAWMIALLLALCLLLSAFLNNTPIVVILIPILQALAHRMRRAASAVMIPLSYAAILGGMTTLIGSSTNLLVSGTLVELGGTALTMFEFTGIGVILAGVGLVYTILVAPRLLPDRSTLASTLVEGSGKQFIAQVTVSTGSRLAGSKAVGGFFPALGDVTVRMIQRKERAFLPPFDDIVLVPGDILVLAATRAALTETLKHDPGLVTGDGDPEAENGTRRGAGRQMLAEVMVAPASRMIGQNLQQIGFRYHYSCIVLGIQRRSRMIRAQLDEIRLEAGDVLLIQGHADDVQALRGDPDMVLMEWSAADLPSQKHARRGLVIFCAMVLAAGSGLVPIVIAALAGAVAMIAAGCLNIRQASRAIDRRIVFLIAATLAMGAALQETGGATYIAHNAIAALGDVGPVVIISAFFLVVALMTNLLSNNACAVLFTPIAIGLADALKIDPHVLAITVLLAANCSFASPIGYQTNLLVMGPGHYRFLDFARAGMPLVLILWITFTLVMPIYFGL